MGSNYQLLLPLDIEVKIPDDDPVRLVRFIIEGMDLTELYRTYSHREKFQATPRQMLEILVYANMNCLFSSRKIEEACRRDINFLYLLEGNRPPDHATIARFRSKHLGKCSEVIFAQMSRLLGDLDVLSKESLFIDGTKIEAVANKYKFVWKKAVTKQQEKLLSKIPEFMLEVEEVFGIKAFHGSKIHRYHLKKLYKKLKRMQKEAGIIFVHGIGKRKTLLQKYIERTETYLEKTKEYAYKIHTCGKRNSYAKTEPDATFMRLKEDAMRNGQLKPAYNIQFGVDSEFVVWAAVGPQPTDATTLIPFLEGMDKYVCRPYENIVADAGYESEENYSWLEENGRKAYIKPNNYEISKKRKYKQDIGRWENMEYNAQTDEFRCHEGKILAANGTRKYKTATGYQTIKTQYVCRDCEGCPSKGNCIKGYSKKSLEERSKNLEISKKFQRQRAETLARITTEEGILLRMNRSIQAEGAFSSIKSGFSFRRFLSKGHCNVLVESILLAMAQNIKKLHCKIQAKRVDLFLFPTKKAS